MCSATPAKSSPLISKFHYTPQIPLILIPIVTNVLMTATVAMAGFDGIKAIK